MVTRNEMVEMLGDQSNGIVDHNDERSGLALDANPNNRSTKTYTGVTFSLFDPSTWVFRKEDIARPLSNACRWAGHIYPFRSVASHCIHVSTFLRDWGFGPDVQLLGLLHDATEAYLLDIPRPWKSEVVIDGVSYIERESKLEEAFFNWAGLSDAFANHWGDVKKADVASFEVERASRVPGNELPFIAPDVAYGSFLLLWELLEAEIENGL